MRNRHAVPNACYRWSRCWRSTSGWSYLVRLPSRRSSPWPGLGLATYEALKGPDSLMLQGMFLVFSAAVIFFNLVADLLYATLRPAGAAIVSAVAAPSARRDRVDSPPASPGPRVGRVSGITGRG